jgi:hypothetical protein
VIIKIYLSKFVVKFFVLPRKFVIKEIVVKKPRYFLKK